ncbi:hypothetical protein [Rhizobium ruizarguesonis]|uniref:hypothetical protein n=1 Tax=Rhizobium ruizarguesonis TaxID=2081791 RepID=UPI0010F2E1C0|nr:hypothetical protein [Rhizobium ruizarguesonis]TBA03106.1 hypothetical protein ELH64_01115 [Rhizobium ruizarguesonis]
MVETKAAKNIKANDIAALKNLAMAAAAPTLDYTVYEYIECNVDWLHYCDANDPVDSFEGWQICRAFFTVAKQDGKTSGPSLTAEKWFTVDPVTPRSFSRYMLKFHAEGNGRPPILGEDSKGAILRLENVGLVLIPAQASYADRYAAGCDVPTGP